MAQFPNDTSASGIWTLKKQKRAIQGENWPNRPRYIEEVFNTYLTTGTGSAITVVNGIDLATKGGLVWNKTRSALGAHSLFDTARGVNQLLASNATSQQQLASDTLTAFNSNGFVIGASNNIAAAGVTGVSWTFREQAKFFDIVTYTGNGANRTISHNLGSIPGCIMVKRTDNTGAWTVYHQSLANTEYLILNTTAAKATGATYWNSTTATSTDFSLGTATDVNASGGTYVAYLFAHDAGGFGPSAADNAISCGSYTTDGSGNATISLGYEPQWLLIKKTTGTADNWWLFDNMRGMPVGSAGQYLNPNLSGAEASGTLVAPTATGFNHITYQASSTFIYMAIRRGPMKTPTTGTSVFSPVARSGTGSATNITSPGFPPDLVFDKNRGGGGWNWNWFDRLRGAPILSSDNTAAAVSVSTIVQADWSSTTMLGYRIQNGSEINASANTYSDYALRRAPGFFDEVCYTGTGAATTVSHNLGVVPELMIVKNRSTAGWSWAGYHSAVGNTGSITLNSTGIPIILTGFWNNTDPTTSVFTVGNNGSTNLSGSTYVAYLFASCPGVSKVGSYTGNGSSQTINCGFTAGARFVIIKRTDGAGNWYVWDTARGIVAGNDPYLLLNSNAAEVTTDDSVDTDSTGFIVNQVAATNINVNAATYIYLAIA